LGGSTFAIASHSADICTTFREVERLAPEFPTSASLVRLRPGDLCLFSTAVEASADIGLMYGSSWGPSLYGCCFSTATVSVEGLELPEQAGALWDFFLHLELVPLL